MYEYAVVKQQITSDAGFTEGQVMALRKALSHFAEAIDTLEEENQMLRDRVEMLEEC